MRSIRHLALAAGLVLAAGRRASAAEPVLGACCSRPAASAIFGYRATAEAEAGCG